MTASPTRVAKPERQHVTFTATVTPASGTQYPSGTVAFYDGNNQIGTTQTVAQVGTTNVGTASITLSTLAAGIHGDITAQYTPAPGNGLIASGSSMNLVAGDPTDNPISYTINAPQATGVDVSPVVGQPFTGVVATFSDGTDTNPTGFSATITWANGQTTSGVIAFAGSNNETNINGQIVTVSLFTVTGTYTYATAGTYPISVTITDPDNNTATVNLTARVAYPPLVVTGVATINAGCRHEPHQSDRRHLHRSWAGGEPGRPGHHRPHDPVLGQHQLGRRHAPLTPAPSPTTPAPTSSA